MTHLNKIHAALEEADLLIEDSILEEALQESPMEEAEEAGLLEEQSLLMISLEDDEAAISEVTKAMDIVASASKLVQESLDKRGLVRPDTLAIIDNAVQAIAPSTPTEVSLEAEGDAPAAATTTPAPGQTDKAAPAQTPQNNPREALKSFADKGKKLVADLIEWLKGIGKRISEFFDKERILIKNLKGRVAQLIEKGRKYAGVEITLGGLTQLGENKVQLNQVSATINKSFTEAVSKLTAIVNASASMASNGFSFAEETLNSVTANVKPIPLTGGRVIRVRSQDGKFFVIEKLAKDFVPSEEKITLDRNAYVNSLRAVLSMLQLADKLNQDEAKLKSISEQLVRAMEAATKENKTLDSKSINHIKALRNAAPRLVATLRGEAVVIYKAFANAEFKGGAAGQTVPGKPAEQPAAA